MARSSWILALVLTDWATSRSIRRIVLTTYCLLAFPAVSPAQRPLGLDTSHYQGSNNWTTIKNGGRVFAWTKATEGVGSGLNDATFVPNMVNARAAGIYIGAYDFAHPENNTPQAEANHFVSVAQNYITPGYARPTLDLESGGGQAVVGAANLSDWTNAWCNSVKTQTGVEPIVYCNTNYATVYLNSTVASRTLWVANYPASPDPQTGNPGTGVWATWDFWQYSSTTNVSGIGINPCDVDVFHFAASQLPNYVIPSIVRSPGTLSNSSIAGANAASQTFTVKNGITGISVPLNYTIVSDQTWVNPTPASGTSTGELDTITLNYATSGLAIGSYSATITITNGTTWYTPVTLSIALTVHVAPGDLNNDGRVNDLDVPLFLVCTTGADLGPAAAGCQDADIDNDNDVDSSDFAIMQRCMNGNLTPPANCAG